MSPLTSEFSRDQIERVSQLYHTNKDSGAVLEITGQSTARLCRKCGFSHRGNAGRCASARREAAQQMGVLAVDRRPSSYHTDARMYCVQRPQDRLLTEDRVLLPVRHILAALSAMQRSTLTIP